MKIHFENWVNAQNAEFVFKETALLFELKLNESCYQSILVTADENIRIKRVMDRDGRTYREVKEIIDKQMPEVDKVKLADFVIQNNTDLESLKEFTHQVLDELNPNSAIEKKEYFSILISNCVAVEKNKR